MNELIRSLARPPRIALRAAGITPPGKVLCHLHMARPFVIQLPAGRGKLKLISWGNRIEKVLFWRGWTGHETEVLRWWGRFALEACTVLDVGANKGSFAYSAKTLSLGTTLYPFEPLARIADKSREAGIGSGLAVLDPVE